MKSSVNTLKTIISIVLLVVPLLAGRAQSESANIYNYTPQPGFRKSNLDGKTEFYFKKNKKWVIIDLFDIRPSYGNAAEDAQNDWNEIVKNNYVIKGDVVTENQEQNGWQVTAQTAMATIFKKINLSLITFSCPTGHASILLTNNDFENVLDNEIGAFIGSLSLVSPTEAASYINPGENIPVTGINTTQPDPNYQMPGLTNPPAPQTDSGNYSPQSGNFDTPL
ncbi:MAG: hypothetical protein KDC69_07130, partial [Flavobacteriaceae bacterium]|nr:hypothetical protein [Flavobacteriaceae bacterium]